MYVWRLKNSGFTLVEILAMVMIFLILAVIIMPRFVDLESAVQKIKLQRNMSIVQAAAESYARSNHGFYPTRADDPAFKSFFPGGNCNLQAPNGGNYPENPFTHIAEAPLQGHVIDVAQMRLNPPPDLGGSRVSGKIFYNGLLSVDSDKATGYAILAADKYGTALTGPKPGTTLIFSRISQTAAQQPDEIDHES